MAKKKTKKSVSKKETKEKVVEVFDVKDKKTGKEKEIVKVSEIVEPKASKKDLQNQERQLKIILGVIGIILFLIIFSVIGLKMIRNVNYEGVKFEVVQEGELILYNTKIPIYKDSEHVADYNFYLRTNPKELKKVPFEGELLLRKGYTINVTTDNLFCDGDWSIAIANLQTQYKVIGSTLIVDANATCDNLSRYTYFEIKEGNETKIVQRDGKSCYDIYVSDCEILQATEKIMVETFVKLNENL